MILEELIAKLGFRISNLNEARKFIRVLEDVKKASSNVGKGFKLNFTGNASGLSRIAKDFERAAAAARRFRQEADRAARPNFGRGVGGRMRPGAANRRGRSGVGEIGEAGLAGAGVGLGRATAAAATAYAGGRLASATLKSSMDFERSMIEVAKAADVQGSSRDEMAEKIMRIARDTGKSKEDIASMTAAAGFAGRPANELMSFAEYGAKATVAWGMGPEETGQNLAQLANIYGVDQKGIEARGDMINTMADKSAAREADLLSFLTYAGASGKQSNLGAEDILPYAAAMKEVGVRTETAATSFQALLNAMKLGDEMSKDAEDGFKKLGTTGEKVQKAFVKAPADAMADLLDRFRKIKDPIKLGEALTNIFGKEHQDDIAKLLNGYDKIAEYRKLLANPNNYSGSVRGQFQEQLQNDVSKIDQSTQQIDVLMKRAGDYSKVALGSAAEVLNKAIDNLEKGSTPAGTRTEQEVVNRLRELNGLGPEISTADFNSRFEAGGALSSRRASMIMPGTTGLPGLTRQPKGMPTLDYSPPQRPASTTGPTFSPSNFGIGGAQGKAADWMNQGAKETVTNNITNNTNTGNDQRTQTASVTVNATGLAEVAALVKSSVQSGLSSMGASIVKGNSASTGASTAP